MATAIKRLGAVAPSATTNTTLYQVPSSTSAVIDASGVTVCNRSSTTTTFRVARVDAGTTPATEDYVEYDQIIPANSEIHRSILCGAAMGAQDSIIVYAGTADLSFTVGGVEIT